MSAGWVAGLFRYPVKSMQGEAVDAVAVTALGIAGDRAFAMLDVESGRVVSAHHPTKWGFMLHFSARWDGEPGSGTVIVTLPDGRAIPVGADLESALSDLCGRELRLITEAPAESRYEIVHPDLPGAVPEVFVERTLAIAGAKSGRTGQLRTALDAPADTLVDCAPLHLLTLNSLRAAAAIDPDAGDLRRYRPNIVLELDEPADTFEASCLTSGVARIGGLEVEITMPTPRCIMPTLPQRDVPASRATLGVLVERNRLAIGASQWPCLGYYARSRNSVVLAVGDRLTTVV